MFPYLSFKEIDPNWQKNAAEILKGFIDESPGRADLFEAYAAQGLPLDVNMGTDINGIEILPLDYLDEHVSELETRHGEDTIVNLRFLLTKLGAVSTFGMVSVLSSAVLFKEVKLVKLLLAQGVDANRDPRILEKAVHKRDEPMVKLLLAHGADVNASPDILISAARILDTYDTSMLKLLLDSGANKKTVHEARKATEDLAKKRKTYFYDNVIRMLKEAERGRK
jgi:hypothetical protein